MISSKGQSSMEFFTLVGLAFLFAILFVALSINEIKEFRDKKEFFLVKELSLKLQKEAAIAASVENGYERTFTLEDKLDNTFDYFITTKNNSVTINTSKAVFSAATPLIDGNFTKGTNKIKKTSGKIYISK